MHKTIIINKRKINALIDTSVDIYELEVSSNCNATYYVIKKLYGNRSCKRNKLK